MNPSQPNRPTPDTSSPKIVLSARPERRLIRPGGSYRHVDFQLSVSQPTSTGPATRTPVRLALVLDRSGSMAGDKLVTAKRATLAVLDQLGEQDQVAVVVFDERIDVLGSATAATPAAKEHLRAALTPIEARASTALHEGWLTGAREIASGGLSPADRGTARVFLLTDGVANVGLSDPEEIASQAAAVRETGRVGTSTFGIGSDYNEALLGPMAVAGGGQFHHLRTAGDIARTFIGELGDLLAVAAGEVTLELELAPDLRVDVVSAYRPNAGSVGPTRQSILIGDLLSGEERHVVVRFGFPPRNGRDHCAIQARVTWLVGGAEQQADWQQIELAYARDAACNVEARDPAVMHWVGLHHAERARRLAADASRKGNREVALDLVHRVAPRIAEYANGDPDLLQAIAELHGLEQELAAAPLAAAREKEISYQSTRLSRGQKDYRGGP
jgi:Ca-activated chloride channel family protein